ncbi:MAG: Gfo/Idh/MocA family oxidoreductase, partial [Candidatus Limnocylindrales bacterium]
IEIWRHGPAPERPCDEGVALDLAIHDLDLLRHVFDDEPVLVEARPNGQASIVERLDAQTELQSGGRASLSVGWDTAARERRIVVVGESGTIEADLVQQELRYCLSGDPEWRSQSCPGEPLVHEHDAFFEAVRNGGPAPVSSLDGFHALFLVHALLDSAATGRPVPVLPSELDMDMTWR